MTTIMTLFDMEYSRQISLDVVELEFVVVECVTHGVPTGNPINATMAQITDTGFCMIVDERSNVGHVIVLWQEKLIIGVAEGIDI